MANDNHIPLYIGQPVRPDVDNEELGGPKLGPHHRASDPTVLQTDDPRFNPPTPSPLKRAVLLFSVFCLFWFALRLRTARPLPASPALETYRCFAAHIVHRAFR